MKSIFEDNNYSFSTFITSTTHTDGYAALIYRDEVTDDYSQKEQPIQSLFFHYLEPQSSGQVGEFTDYVGMEFFTGHGKTPLLALADASEQCEAYYKAQKENVEVALVGGRVKYIFPVLTDEPKAWTVETIYDGKDGRPYSDKQVIADQINGQPTLIFNGPKDEVPTKGKTLADIILSLQPTIGERLPSIRDRWDAYKNGQTAIGDVMSILGIFAQAAFREAVQEGKHNNGDMTAVEILTFTSPILSYQELMSMVTAWEDKKEIKHHYQYLFRAILNVTPHAHTVREVINGFTDYVLHGTPAAERYFNIITLCGSKDLPFPAVKELSETFAAREGSFARAKPTSAGGRVGLGIQFNPTTSPPSEWDLLDSDARAYYDDLAAREHEQGEHDED